MTKPEGQKLLVTIAASMALAFAAGVVRGQQDSAPTGVQKQVAATPQSGPFVGPGIEVNRAIARKQLALIDEAWEGLEDLAKNGRIEIGHGTFGPWGRRRLEALRRVGAEKAEIVAALEKYIKDLDRMLDNVKHLNDFGTWRNAPGFYEIRYLRTEAEIWLNEEKAR